MANRKTAKAPEKEQKRGDTSVSARIDRLVDYENSKVKAIASAKDRKAGHLPVYSGKFSPILPQTT